MISGKGRILLSVTGWSPDVWLEALRDAAPDREIVLQPAGSSDPTIDYAVVWKQPTGVLNRLPNLKAIFSIGAGVDHVFHDQELPEVPIVRVVSPDLTLRMSEYVVWQVLDHHRQGPAYRDQQRRGVWREDRDQRAASEVTVGIMGLGQLGLDAAKKLAALGFRVTGWSRRAKTPPQGVKGYAGDGQLDAFLAGADILVCLLPLTPETRHILSAPLFARMKRVDGRGAPVLINAGRGALQKEADILAALDSGVLSAASLDVFETEPLPPESLLWQHPRVFITPHAAAASSPPHLVPPMIRQMERLEAGGDLENVVDRSAQY
ncbi:2-hydroxyacid dehydrogenase [Pararhizobium haloflavum]|uniref:2-hydroxyacid dehydrogenase n=1 Tax=Pararhizobium haloflavum TaxID=2037914 RepID=UPI000C1916C3|nr:glyoxylate/hydroxypyruvate reductase A [Pararhizobium haloflavum]